MSIVTPDGLKLEGELVTPEEPVVAAVLTHPHPRHGGNMRSMVPGELIKSLPPVGCATLRFNFRGMGASEGSFEDGIGERIDTIAAVDLLHEAVEGLPIVLCGSSFGADTALTVEDERVAGWCAMAPPLRDHHLEAMHAVAADRRPKLLIVAERDQIRSADAVSQITSTWTNTEVVVVPGADHFFVGKIERVIERCTQFVQSFSAQR